MTCRLQERLTRLTRIASQSSERLTIWHPHQGKDSVQVTLSTDPEQFCGDGDTICEALADLESQLNVLPPEECRECGG